jgi:hypothetical protein
MAIWYFCGSLVYFSHFGILYQEKYGNPACNCVQIRENNADVGLLRIIAVNIDPKNEKSDKSAKRMISDWRGRGPIHRANLHV